MSHKNPKEMLMNANITLHPAIDCYYKNFLEKPAKPKGMLAVDSDELKLGPEVLLEGNYLVCARKIHLNIAKSFCSYGPGGGLIAAKKIQIAAPTIILSGDKDHPITIVALDSLDLESRHFQLNHVTLVVMPNTYVKIDLSLRRFEHLKVIEIDEEGKPIRKLTCDYSAFMQYVLDKKERTESAAYFNMTQIEIARKMRVKSPLINPSEFAPLNFFDPETKIPKEFIKELADEEIAPILRKIDQQQGEI